MPSANVETQYREGCIEGFKSARGRAAPSPDVPEVPEISNDSKAHDIGWHDGRLHGLDATVPDIPSSAAERAQHADLNSK